MHSCFCFAFEQASLHPKDEEYEQQTATLVESALSLYNTVGETFKQSTRAGGYVSYIYFYYFRTTKNPKHIYFNANSVLLPY